MRKIRYTANKGTSMKCSIEKYVLEPEFEELKKEQMLGNISKLHTICIIRPDGMILH